MGDYIVIVTLCQNPLDRHEQRIPVQFYDENGAKQLASILDGTDECYVESPRDNPNSVLAHCRVCGALIDATVEGEFDATTSYAGQLPE